MSGFSRSSIAVQAQSGGQFRSLRMKSGTISLVSLPTGIERNSMPTIGAVKPFSVWVQRNLPQPLPFLRSEPTLTLHLIRTRADVRRLLVAGGTTRRGITLITPSVRGADKVQFSD